MVAVGIADEFWNSFAKQEFTGSLAPLNMLNFKARHLSA